MLQAGGNAIDAAVATHFALAVVNPEAGNIGGGGFLVARMADDTRVALDFREKAPLAASADMYLDEEGRVTDAGVIGHLASGVPGSVAGMRAAWERFGTVPWSDLLEPAVRLARDGFVIGPRHLSSVGSGAEILLRFPTTAAVFLPGGQPPPQGAPSSGSRTWRGRSSRSPIDGAAAFYTGWIADSTVAEMERGGGIITHEDLASYEAVWRDPVTLGYRGYEIITMPPPSSGGITMGQILNIVESFDLASFGWLSADHVHVAVEAMRRAYADRNFFLGDPDFVEIPTDRLLSQAYADSLAGTIDMRLASDSRAFNRVPEESTQTTHYSIVDREGNAVAVTTTINSWFGSKVVVRGAGYLLNNEMDDFTSKPGVPNQFGLVQGEANAIAPGKRMLSAMTPTIVVDSEGRTDLVTGTPGGATIITTIFQIVSNYIDFAAAGPELRGCAPVPPPAPARPRVLRACGPFAGGGRRAAEARARARGEERDQRRRAVDPGPGRRHAAWSVGSAARRASSGLLTKQRAAACDGDRPWTDRKVDSALAVRLRPVGAP